MPTANVTISGQKTGLSDGSTEQIGPITISNANSGGAVSEIVTVNGDNTITVPTAGATYVSALLMPPAGNAIAIKLKGAGADTGVLLHKTLPTLLSLDPGQASIIVNTAGIINLQVRWW